MISHAIRDSTSNAVISGDDAEYNKRIAQITMNNKHQTNEDIIAHLMLSVKGLDERLEKIEARENCTK
ncbi:MAG: hypothetical protein R8M45_03910 [Ghiorsea sp.]